jgi:hypothetical protein
MNPQEHEMLSKLLGQLAQAQAGQKDPEAERMIGEACTRQPDAAYLLVQRTLLLEQALQSAHGQIAALQAERDQSRPPVRGDFLDANGWGNPAASRATAEPRVAAVPTAPSWGSSFLGSVATTAAGVVAGSFLFQGIEHLIGGHGGLGASHVPQGLTENTVTNNYYDSNSSDASDLAALTDIGDGSDDWI